MGWATRYIEKLNDGETVKFRPRGHSMTGKINDGQLVTVEPIKTTTPIVPGETIVLCKVNGTEYLHLVSAVGSDDRFQISNNKGHVNGWTGWASIYGVVVKVEK